MVTDLPSIVWVMRIVPEHADGWNVVWRMTPEAYRERLGVLDQACAAAGRDPRSVSILGGISLVAGRSDADAQEKYDRLKQQLDPDVARFRIAQDLEADLTGLDWNSPIPLERIPEGSKYFSAFKNELVDGRRGRLP